MDKCQADNLATHGSTETLDPASRCAHCRKDRGRARNEAGWCSACRVRWPISYAKACGYSDRQAVKRWEKRNRYRRRY